MGRCIRRMRLRTTYPRRHRDWYDLCIYGWSSQSLMGFVVYFFAFRVGRVGCFCPDFSPFLCVFILVSERLHLFQLGLRCRILQVKIIFLLHSALHENTRPELQIRAWLAGVWTPVDYISQRDSRPRVRPRANRFCGCSLWIPPLGILSPYDPGVIIRDFGLLLPMSLISWSGFGIGLKPTELLEAWPRDYISQQASRLLADCCELRTKKMNFPACCGQPAREAWTCVAFNDLGVADSISHGALKFFYNLGNPLIHSFKNYFQLLLGLVLGSGNKECTQKTSKFAVLL